MSAPILPVVPVVYTRKGAFRSYAEFVASNYQPEPHRGGKFRHQLFPDRPFRMYSLMMWNPSGILTSLEVGLSEQLPREPNVLPLRREDRNQLVEHADLQLFQVSHDLPSIMRALFSGMQFQNLVIPTVNIGVPLTIEGDGSFDELLIAGVEPSEI